VASYENFNRFLDHLANYHVEHPELRIREIIETLNVFDHMMPASVQNKELLFRRIALSGTYALPVRAFSHVRRPFL
jgi:hypothetical protein